jgi:Tol biopolymer transport system component
MTRGIWLAATLSILVVACDSTTRPVGISNSPQSEFVAPRGAVASPSGRYIAYLHFGRLWVSDGHSVGIEPSLPAQPPTGPNEAIDRFAWSPLADVLVVAPASNDKAPGLWIVSPDGAAHLVSRTSYQTSFAWSPDGARLLYTQVGGPPRLCCSGHPDEVQLADVSSGRIQSLSIQLSGSGFDLIRIDRWWPDGSGFDYWRDSHRATWDSLVQARASGLPEPSPSGGGVVKVGCSLDGHCQLAVNS